MNKKQLLWAWLLALMLPATLSAQTWTASAPADGGTYYLYNVGREAFMYGHNDWDTRASLTKDGGIPFTLVSSGDAYYLSSAPTYPNLFLGSDGWVDKANTSSKYAAWTFTPVTGMENTYTLRNSVDNNYIVAHASDATKTSMTATAPTTNMGYWRLVSKADYIAGMAEADADNPVDATKLFQNPYIGRVTDASCWQGGPGFNGVNDNWCFEKYNTTFDVYQEIEGVPNGIYTLKCQGFYRMGGRTDATNRRNAGEEVLNAKYYINTAEGSLKSIFDYSRATAFADGYNENRAYTVNGTAYYLPNTHAQAANNCRKDEYWNDPIRVVVTDGKLRIGVKKTVAVGSDWTIFDNFVVTYYGVDMTAMLSQAKLNWASKYEAIVSQATDRSAYDAVIAAADSYCTTEEKLAEYDGIVWQTVCDLLTNGTPANGSGQFDITSLVENPTFDTSVAGWDVTGTAGINATYGVAEFFNQPDVSLTQTLANMPAGTYTLKAQAFYRSTAWRDATYYYRQGTDVVKANFLLGNQSVPVCNIYDQSRYQPAYLSGNAGGSNQKMAPDSMHGASAAFDIGQYWNLLSTTTDAAGNLTFGLNIVGGLENDWMCFDNFRLYYGAAAAVVDLTSAIPTEDTQASTVTTGITLTAGDYNKVCLPFDLDAAQTAAAFSAAYTLGGVTADGVAQLVPAYTIEAGRAYFVTVDATKLLAIDSPVRIRVAQPDSIPVMWEGAATVGTFDGFTFDVNLSDGYSITSYEPVDLQNMAFTVNQENWRVRRFLNEFTYDENTASKIRAYNVGYPVSLDQPHSVFIPVPQNNAVLTVTVSKNADYSEAETFSFAAGTTLCEVPNLIPQNTYYYKVEAGGSVITKGQFTTEGRIRMIKANSGINIRDLGGWETLDGNHLRYGKIFRGAELNYGTPVSAADLAELRRLGIGAELDFRYTPDTNNETPTVSALGNDAPYLFFDQTYADASPTNFISDKDIYRQAFQLNLEQLRSGVATYFHCRIGADRTGSYALLVEGLCGVTLDQFAKDYELTTFSKSGTREWNQPGYNLLGKLEDINAFPGNTLQQKFFYYMNHELGIPAADLFEFIELMVEGDNKKSLTNADLAFGNTAGEYLQSIDEIAAFCANGSVVFNNSKAQLSDGTTTSDVTMTIDGITITFSDVTFEPGKDYTLTIPQGAIQKDGVENAAEAVLTFHTPYIFDGVYYLYSPYYDGFISGGQAYGTSVVVDNYGMPFEWKVDRNTGYSKIRFISSDLYLYGPNWVFIDGLSDDARIYDVLPSTDAQLSGYYLHDRGLDDGYLYTRKPDKSNPRAVASNGSVEERGSDCCTWQFWTKAERDAKVNGYPAQNIETVIAASGINATATTFATVLDTDYTSIDRSSAVGTTSFGNGVGNWTFTSTSTTDGYPDYNNREGNAYGRCYETTGVHTLTIPAANVPAGIYKVELGAFERHTNEAIDTRMWNDGFTDPVSAYLAANDEQVPFMSWYQMNQNADANGQTAVYVGQSLTQQAAFIAAGYADICLYIYLDGETDLTLKIADPNRVWNGSAHYVVFNNLRLTQYLPNVTLDETAAEAPQAAKNVNLTFKRNIVAKTNVESGNAWNTICFPFALTQAQIKAAFGENTIVKELSDVTTNGENASLTFAEVTAIEANKPYIMQTDQAGTEYTFEGIDITPSEDLTQTVDGLQFVGNYIYPCVMANDGGTDYYILNDLFKSSTGRTKIKGFRAYFHVPESSGIKALGFDESEATGIFGIDANEKQQEIYDLQGRKVNGPLTKGIYIVNGKKMLLQ